MNKRISVQQNMDNEVPTAVMAESIVAISAGIKKLRSTRLNDDALYLLIQHASPSFKAAKNSRAKISINDIKMVFAGIASLEKSFLKKRPAS